MKIIDWVAILGALAWSPHLISFIKSYLTKPEIRIISQRSAEIGFSTFGPIFNIRLAFSVKNHDIVVSNLRVRLIHESGEEKYFEWQNVKQQVATIQTREGAIPYEKENSVLAIKINQKDIEERQIQCRETSFISGRQNIDNSFFKRLSFEKEKQEYDPILFLDSQEANDVYNYIKHAFNWKAGRYKVEYLIESPEKFTLLDNMYEFSLLPIDIEQLDKNKEYIKQEFVNSFTSEGHVARKNIIWNWRYPAILKRN